MGKIIYMEDRINGLHCYTPEWDSASQKSKWKPAFHIMANIILLTPRLN